MLEPELERYVFENASCTALALYDSGDPERALTTLRRAARAVGRIPDPDEPDDSLPSWYTAFMHDDGVPMFHLDMQDNRHYARPVARLVLDYIELTGADGRLAPYERPDPGYQADHRADIFGGTPTSLDARGLLPTFPDGFPAPDGAEPVLDPAGVDVAETVLSMLEPARFLQDLRRRLGTAERPDPRLLTGLLADLEPDRIATATEACWLIARR